MFEQLPRVSKLKPAQAIVFMESSWSMVATSLAIYYRATSQYRVGKMFLLQNLFSAWILETTAVTSC